MTDMMRAVCYRQTGSGPDVLHIEEFSIPTLSSDEVLVKVHMSGVNPTDCKRRSGFRGVMPYDVVIPGYDASGEIIQVGANVSNNRIGERVWVWEGAHLKWDGTAAEYVRVPSSRAMALPDWADDELGASLGVPAITAAHALRIGAASSGDVVVITGGGGAVGNAAVSLAHRAGCIVVTTARDDARKEDARAAGADYVLEPDNDQIKEKVLSLSHGKGARVMIDVDWPVI
jgi:NADPH:quinone reductase and related Zn-dependent oxidoreductases